MNKYDESVIKADLDVNASRRSRIFLQLFRRTQSHLNGGILFRIYSGILIVLYGNTCDIKPNTIIGKGVRFPHLIGIVISKNAIIGNYCTIFHGVTIGAIELQGITDRAPRIGNNVYIGAGAKILGDISIGDNVKIGANAVVTKDIPSNVTVVGVNSIINVSTSENEFVK